MMMILAHFAISTHAAAPMTNAREKSTHLQRNTTTGTGDHLPSATASVIQFSMIA